MTFFKKTWLNLKAFFSHFFIKTNILIIYDDDRFSKMTWSMKTLFCFNKVKSSFFLHKKMRLWQERIFKNQEASSVQRKNFLAVRTPLRSKFIFIFKPSFNGSI